MYYYLNKCFFKSLKVKFRMNVEVKPAATSTFENESILLLIEHLSVKLSKLYENKVSANDCKKLFWKSLLENKEKYNCELFFIEL